MRLSTRKGFALPIAIGSMIVIGMILAGVFFAATQENRAGRNTITQERAFRAAEFGLNTVYGKWDNPTFNALTNGSVAIRTYKDTARGTWFDTLRVTRLNTNTFWLVSTGTAGSTISQARHRTGLVVRLTQPQINFLAALTVHGTTQLGGSSYTTGQDTPPTGWNCPPPGAEQAGIAVSNVSTVITSGCNAFSCVDGSPQILSTNAVNDTNTFFTYGPDANWASLTAMADLTYAGNNTITGQGPSLNADGTCRYDAGNWGDPSRHTPVGACESYFPIIYFSGQNTSNLISGGVGQGILLVDGDLQVDGGFQWYGPVIVRGRLATQGTGGHFNGAVMAANVDFDQNTVLGNATITYSGCAISAALVGAGSPKRLKYRSWAEMF